MCASSLCAITTNEVSGGPPSATAELLAIGIETAWATAELSGRVTAVEIALVENIVLPDYPRDAADVRGIVARGPGLVRRAEPPFGDADRLVMGLCKVRYVTETVGPREKLPE